MKIELLAPAKNKECAISAINAGADAVYIGAASFGARKNAGNSLDEIKDIVDYAHIFNVKVYVTVNTILYDNELKTVEKLIWALYEIGVDAIIFQDFSFFEMNLPPIALHASTQCNNDSIEKIKFLKQMNVERVVLPREFSIQQIKSVIDNVDIETEVFVHGALCVSYSGQCYLSNYIGGRSANRGECAQPCRKKYTLVDNDGNVILNSSYLLSMKDNNQSLHLKKFIDAGITSLKIEGRLKDKAYVSNIVSYYRKELDKISKDISPACGILSTNFEPNVAKTFNRTYTDFFIDGNRKIFVNTRTPKFIGEYIGTVTSVSKNLLVLDRKHKLNISDKLAFFNKDEATGTTVTRLFGNKIEVLKSNNIFVGTKLYRNYDYEFYKKLDSTNFIRKMPVNFVVDNDKIQVISLNGHSFSCRFEDNFEIANNLDKAKQNVVKQLSKLGGTEFVCQEVIISDGFDKFIPVSKLNEIRRKAIDELRIFILGNYKYNRREIPVEHPEYPIKTLNYSFNVSNNLSKCFYEKCGSSVTELSPELCMSFSKQHIELMKTKHCLRDLAGICTKKSKDNRSLFLLDESGEKYPLVFDCNSCVMKILKP